MEEKEPKPIEQIANFGYQCDLDRLEDLYKVVRQLQIVCEQNPMTFSDFIGALAILKASEINGDL